MPDPIADISGSLTSGLNAIAMLLDKSRESKESKAPSLTLEQYNNYFKKIDVLTEKVEQSNKQIDRANLNLASLISGLSNTNTVLRQIYDFVSKRTQPLTTPQLPLNTNNTLVEGNNRQQPIDLTPVLAKKEIAPPTSTFTSLVPRQSELTLETEQYQEHQSSKKLLALATTQAEGVTSIDKSVTKILKKLGSDEDGITTKQAGGGSGGVLGALESLALYELLRRALANKNVLPSEGTTSATAPATAITSSSTGTVTNNLPPERVQLIQPELPASTRPALDYKNSMAERTTLPKVLTGREVPPSEESIPIETEVLPPEAEPVPVSETSTGKTTRGATSINKLGNTLKYANRLNKLGTAGLVIGTGYQAYEGYQDYQEIEQREREGKISQQKALEEKGQKIGERGGHFGSTLLASTLAGTAIGGTVGLGVGALPGAIAGLVTGIVAASIAEYSGVSGQVGKLTGAAGKAITPWAYETFNRDKNNQPVKPYDIDKPQGDQFYGLSYQKEGYKNYRPGSFETIGGEFKPAVADTFKPAPNEQLQKLVIEQPKEATLSLKEIAEHASTSNKKFDGMIDALGMLTNALLTNSDNNNQAISNIQAQLNAARSTQSAGGTNNSSEQVDISETSVPMFGIPTMRQKFSN